MTNTFLNKINPTANRQNNRASPFSSFSSIKKRSTGIKAASPAKFSNALKFYAETFGMTLVSERRKERKDSLRDVIFTILVSNGSEVPEFVSDDPF